MRGTVSTFDKAVGLGEIVSDDGRIVPFHCIVIADGSRDIDIGVTVEFDLMGKLGRYEATRITQL